MICAQFSFRSLSQMHEKNEWYTPPIKEANKIHFLTPKMFVPNKIFSFPIPIPIIKFS